MKWVGSLSNMRDSLTLWRKIMFNGRLEKNSICIHWLCDIGLKHPRLSACPFFFCQERPNRVSRGPWLENAVVPPEG
jgi:hypothetical protein